MYLYALQDIDCMPLNPLENMPASLARHTIGVDKFLENFNELKANGHTKDQGAEGYIKFSSCENLENIVVATDNPACNLLKQAKVSKLYFIVPLLFPCRWSSIIVYIL